MLHTLWEPSHVSGSSAVHSTFPFSDEETGFKVFKQLIQSYANLKIEEELSEANVYPIPKWSPLFKKNYKTLLRVCDG